MQKKWSGEGLRFALEELAAFGSPVDLSVVQEDLSLNIQQVGGVSDSIIFDLPNHRAGYILDIEFLNLRSTTIYLQDLELQLPWEDPWFQWLPDPGTQNHNAKKAQGKNQNVSGCNLHRGIAFRPRMGLSIRATRSLTTTWPKMEN